MHLTWSNTSAIVEALAKAYPDVDRCGLTNDDILTMINNLPGFIDTKQPPSTSYIDHIMWTWMRIVDPCFEKAV